MKRMTETQAAWLTALANELDSHDDPQARARAAGLRGRVSMTPRISSAGAYKLATNAQTHLDALGIEKRARERRIGKETNA